MIDRTRRGERAAIEGRQRHYRKQAVIQGANKPLDGVIRKLELIYALGKLLFIGALTLLLLILAAAVFGWV